MGILSFFLGSSIGRYIAIGGLTVGVIFIYAYFKGKRAGLAVEAAARLKRIRDRIRTDDEITRMHPDARRRELNRWVRADD